MADPARTEYVPPVERRKRAVEACRDVPCFSVQQLLKGDLRYYPHCILCVHEGAVRKMLATVKKS